MSIISNEHQGGSPFECPGCFRARDECECPPRPEAQPALPVDLSELDRLCTEHESTGRWMHYADALMNDWPAISAELRTLRARVGELEESLRALHHFAGRGDGHGTAEKAADCIAGVIIQLRADLEKAEARAESAEARVTALEKLFDDAGQGEHNVLALIDHYQSEAMAESEARRAALARVGELECAEADLESQLADAREEQSLEAKVREALGVRFWSLSIVGGFDNARAGFRAYWPGLPGLTPSRAAPPNPIAVAPTIPALLRAILEVEAKGGPSPCQKPPDGWLCTRDAGHDGPCAARPEKGPSSEG